MGTDVYLRWKGMTKQEKDAQYTGFSINAGKIGYLRASIGMFRENAILCQLFPEKFWDGGKTLRYNFIFNIRRLQDLLVAYMTGEIIIDENADKQKKYAEKLFRMFSSISVEVETHIENKDDDYYKVVYIWIEPFKKFEGEGQTKDHIHLIDVEEKAKGDADIGETLEFLGDENGDD